MTMLCSGVQFCGHLIDIDVVCEILYYWFTPEYLLVARTAPSCGHWSPTFLDAILFWVSFRIFAFFSFYFFLDICMKSMVKARARLENTTVTDTR